MPEAPAVPFNPYRRRDSTGIDFGSEFASTTNPPQLPAAPGLTARDLDALVNTHFDKGARAGFEQGRAEWARIFEEGHHHGHKLGQEAGARLHHNRIEEAGEAIIARVEEVLKAQLDDARATKTELRAAAAVALDRLKELRHEVHKLEELPF